MTRNLGRQTWDILSETVSLVTPWFKIRKVKYVAPNGADADYFIHDGKDGVLCVCVTDDDKFLILEQYRVPIGRASCDYPAGGIEPEDASATAAALREVEQETGYRPGSVKELAVMDKDPGFSRNKNHIFIVRDLRPSETKFDDTEDLKLKTMTADEIKQLIKDGRMACAFCLAATLLAFQELKIPLD